MTMVRFFIHFFQPPPRNQACLHIPTKSLPIFYPLCFLIMHATLVPYLVDVDVDQVLPQMHCSTHHAHPDIPLPSHKYGRIKENKKKIRIFSKSKKYIHSPHRLMYIQISNQMLDKVANLPDNPISSLTFQCYHCPPPVTRRCIS